jgi:hypothetical protein
LAKLVTMLWRAYGNLASERTASEEDMNGRSFTCL